MYRSHFGSSALPLALRTFVRLAGVVTGAPRRLAHASAVGSWVSSPGGVAANARSLAQTVVGGWDPLPSRNSIPDFVPWGGKRGNGRSGRANFARAKACR